MMVGMELSRRQLLTAIGATPIFAVLPSSADRERAKYKRLREMGEAWRAEHGDEPMPMTHAQEVELCRWMLRQPKANLSMWGLDDPQQMAKAREIAGMPA